MESVCVYGQKTLINELSQGIQMAKQLKVNLNSPEAREILIQKILASYDNALFVLKSGESAGQCGPNGFPASSPTESAITIASPQSVRSECNQPFSNEQGPNAVSKKRKGSIICEDQVKMCTDDGLEGSVDDGYSWRKYGQKDILGAKFPRSYYRCTYRKAEKCLATKQVQRTDANPTVFEITYKGKHTCNHHARLAEPPLPEKHEINTTHHQQLSQPNPGEMLSNLRANLTVNTSDFGATDPYSFSFPLEPFGTIEDYQQLHLPNDFDDELLQVYSPPVISPGTSDLNCYTDWDSSQSLNFTADLDLDFKF
uniref:WRKY1 transcription factor n=1 Tax=Artemisia annua TaxID=35608 RepID=A0A059PY84_ARTAN|nr:WRKY1 transcription factor [Artemisia annua]